MELSNFGSYAHITTMRQIFELQAQHYTYYLARCAFTRADYYRCRIGWRHCRWWQCAINCGMIATLCAIFAGALPSFDRYVAICAQASKIERYEIFMITEIIGFVSSEVLWYDAFVRQLIGGDRVNGDNDDKNNENADVDDGADDDKRRRRLGNRHGMLEVAYEFANQLDHELTATEHTTFRALFHCVAKYVGHSLKMIFVMLLLFIAQLIVLTFVDLYHGRIDVWQTIAYLVMILVTTYQGTAAMTMEFTVMPHSILVLYIFRRQLIRYQRMLILAVAIAGRCKRHCVLQFLANYARLHRHVLLFNNSFRAQIPVNECVFKFSGLLTVIFYLKQTDSGFGAFTVFINVTYAFMYATLQYTQSRLSYFPNQNLRCYRRVMSLGADAAKFGTSNRCRIVPSPPRRNSPSLRLMLSREKQRLKCEIRHALRLDHLAAFLANNRFGFTYGRMYLITSQSVLSAIGQNFYIMTLLYKRITI